MKKLFAGVMLGLAALMTTGCELQKVPAGNVGIKVYLLGGEKGVDHEAVGPGRYFLTWNEDMFLFPTFTQNVTWSDAQTIGFQSKEGLSVMADVGISYNILPDKVPLVFEKYRKGVDEITDVYLRNMVRDAIVTHASDKPVESLYGNGKTELMTAAEATVRKQVEAIGINVERLYWVGSIKLPPTVVAALNAKIEATQKAQQRENEVAQAKAEADKAVEEARGVADSTLLKAKAEAEAIRIRGEALKQNQQLVDLTLAEKWDGKLPVNMYGNSPVPFINVK